MKIAVLFQYTHLGNGVLQTPKCSFEKSFVATIITRLWTHVKCFNLHLFFIFFFFVILLDAADDAGQHFHLSTMQRNPLNVDSSSFIYHSQLFGLATSGAMWWWLFVSIYFFFFLLSFMDASQVFGTSSHLDLWTFEHILALMMRLGHCINVSPPKMKKKK